MRNLLLILIISSSFSKPRAGIVEAGNPEERLPVKEGKLAVQCADPNHANRILPC